MHLIMVITKVDENDSVYGANICWIESLAVKVKRLSVIGMSVGQHNLPDNVKVYSLGKEYGYSRLRRFVRLEKIVIGLLLRGQVDGIFIHQAQIWGPLLLYCRFLKIPIVLFKAHAILPPNMKLFLPFFDRVVTTIPETFALDTPKKVVVGQGINVYRFKKYRCSLKRPIDSKCIRIMTAGRISPVKGYDVLIEAASKLVCQYGHSLSIHIYGEPYIESDKPYADRLYARVEALNLKGRVVFHGAVLNSQLPEQLNKSDIFIHLSDSGVDRAALESMSCEVPVITSNDKLGGLFGSYSELLCFKRGDGSQLADKVQAFLSLNREDRMVIGSRLRQIVVENHNVRTLMGKIVEIIKSVGS